MGQDHRQLTGEQRERQQLPGGIAQIAERDEQARHQKQARADRQAQEVAGRITSLVPAERQQRRADEDQSETVQNDRHERGFGSPAARAPGLQRRRPASGGRDQ